MQFHCRKTNHCKEFLEEEISFYHKEYYKKNREKILEKHRLERESMTDEEKEEKRVWDRKVYNIRKYKEYMKEKI